MEAMKHADFGAVNAIITLLKVGEKSKTSLMSLLADKYSNYEVEKALKTATDIKAIKKVGLIAATSHFKQMYKVT